MTLYVSIKALATKKSIPISRIERDLGLSNGSISKWNNHTPNAGSLQRVASYLGVTTDHLLIESREKEDK